MHGVPSSSNHDGFVEVLLRGACRGWSSEACSSKGVSCHHFLLVIYLKATNFKSGVIAGASKATAHIFIMSNTSFFLPNPQLRNPAVPANAARRTFHHPELPFRRYELLFIILGLSLLGSLAFFSMYPLLFC